MTVVDLLKKDAEMVYKELLGALDGVTEGQSWTVLPPAADDYLHSDGSIHGTTLHIAVGKMSYGSIGFRNSEIRFRDLADRLEAFEPSWEAARTFLQEAHEYWTASWADLKDEDLEALHPRHTGEEWPAWKLITTVIQHDAYHAGQIALIRYATVATDVKPPSQAEDIRTYCKDLPDW